MKKYIIIVCTFFMTLLSCSSEIEDGKTSIDDLPEITMMNILLRWSILAYYIIRKVSNVCVLSLQKRMIMIRLIRHIF